MKTKRTPRDWFDILTILVAFGALGFSIFTYRHTTGMENQAERRACIGDLASYPSMLREPAQQVTDAIFQWVVAPSVASRKEAKRAALSLTTQLQTLQGTLTKYDCQTTKSVEDFIDFLARIMDSIKKGDSEGADVDAYDNSLTVLLRERSFAKQCCPDHR